MVFELLLLVLGIVVVEVFEVKLLLCIVIIELWLFGILEVEDFDWRLLFVVIEILLMRGMFLDFKDFESFFLGVFLFCFRFLIVNWVVWCL